MKRSFTRNFGKNLTILDNLATVKLFIVFCHYYHLLILHKLALSKTLRIIYFTRKIFVKNACSAL